MKGISAEWMVEMADYIGQNPSFLVNRFIKSGITGALDGHIGSEVKDTDEEQEYESTDDEMICDTDDTNTHGQ